MVCYQLLQFTDNRLLYILLATANGEMPDNS
jgi:hypothetical protein